MSRKDRYWFPAKRYGWGWGPPTIWQGWAVVGTWFLAICIGILFLLPRHLLGFFGLTLVMSVALMLICYAKGEPPQWRWGERR
jgi:hypothetical protein